MLSSLDTRHKRTSAAERIRTQMTAERFSFRVETVTEVLYNSIFGLISLGGLQVKNELGPQLMIIFIID